MTKLKNKKNKKIKKMRYFVEKRKTVWYNKNRGEQ